MQKFSIIFGPPSSNDEISAIDMLVHTICVCNSYKTAQLEDMTLLNGLEISSFQRWVTIS